MTGALANYSASYQTGTPYLTTTEYKAAPMAVDLSNLVPGGDQAAQDQVLANCIARASSTADGLCCYGGAGVLAASVSTESGQVRMRDGVFRFRTRFAPLLEVQALSIGPMPGQLSTVDLSSVSVLVERQRFEVAGYGATTLGPRPWGVVTAGNQYATWTYVSGYANTVLAADASAAATSITVADTTGFYPGLTSFKIFDDGETDEGISPNEPLRCVSVSGSTVTLNRPLTYSHEAGTGVSEFPEAIKQAVILLTTWVIKSRGAQALVIDQLSPSSMPGEAGTNSDWEDAVELLHPYRCLI